jgi:phosphoribosyl-ATP pyrophosphohydrolase
VTTSLDSLYEAICAARSLDLPSSKTAKLFREGMPKMVKKLCEEAVEVGIDALQGNRHETILESADLIYQLYVVLAEMGITPEEVFSEIARREQLYGIAEKLPKIQNGKVANLKEG